MARCFFFYFSHNSEHNRLRKLAKSYFWNKASAAQEGPPPRQNLGFWGFHRNVAYSYVFFPLKYEIISGLLTSCENCISGKNLVLEPQKARDQSHCLVLHDRISLECQDCLNWFFMCRINVSINFCCKIWYSRLGSVTRGKWCDPKFLIWNLWRVRINDKCS